MTEKNRRTAPQGDVIRATIGDNAHQVAVGKDIVQQQINQSGPVTEADLDQVKKLFADFKKQVAKEAPPDKREAALEHADELEKELTSKKPTATTFGYVRNWFFKYAPAVLGGLTSIVVHPIVGKIVEAAGEMAAKEFQSRFG
jgi:hypothetical protein